jgi:hypothetical protein
MSDDRSKKTFYLTPYFIRQLPGMSLALLDFYETMFEFWNKGYPCFLSNEKIMERTGIKSLATIYGAFKYFEKHNVMKRVFKNNRRFVVSLMSLETETDHNPTKKSTNTPVDNSRKNSKNFDRGIGALVGEGIGTLVGHPTSVLKHKINNTKYINLKKSSCANRPFAQTESVQKEKGANARFKQKDPCASDSDARERFDDFWKIYPRKKDKKRAHDIWIKRKLDGIADIIIEKVKKQIEFESQWKNRQYIPHPSRYLSDKLWEDEITESPPNPGKNTVLNPNNVFCFPQKQSWQGLQHSAIKASPLLEAYIKDQEGE